ncbi:Gfo/Idh/MocA family protein [Actinoplanes sp. CA-030573]|uniref:Gfo/Idh/MocA family protein n=1 Tax=Actinoplanes sp. CA-030573 TaxID=3239898 RepID=UPI003D8C81D4
MTRVAVAGLGDVSVVHLAAISSLGADLVGVCDVDPTRAGDGYRDHRALLDATRPDVLHICTPHDQHVQLAIDALERGVNVLMEKPVAHTVAEASRLVEAAAAHPAVKIGVCLQNRYNASSEKVRKVLANQAANGGSATVFWHRTPDYYRASPWRGDKARSGGGVLINQAIHTIDLMQWFLGDVEAVSGHAGRYGGLPGDVEDTAHLLLDHEGGARSVVFATTTNVVDQPVTIEIVTDEAVLTIKNGLTIAYADGRTEAIEERRADGGGRDYWGASHELLIADFYRTLEDPEPFWIGPAEALKSQYLIDQIYRSDT